MNVLAPHSCRICSLDFLNGVFIFGEEGRRMHLQAKIQKYLYIKINLEDKLPKMVCNSCCRRVDNFHKFASMATRIQNKFNDLLFHNHNKNNNTNKKIINKKKNDKSGLLHTYLTNNNNNKVREEVTEEVEIKIDPMIFLQCAIDDKDKDKDKKEERGIKNQIDDFDLNFDKKIGYIKMKKQVPICKRVNFNISNYNYNYNLHAHLEETHSHSCKFVKQKYACDICGRIFKTQFNLHRHKEYHKGIQYPCGVCGRVYPTNSTLRAHSVTHSNLRPHKCSLCDKTFKRNQDLKFHVNQHTGARPYQCPYCPKAFASSGNCFSHRKRMHPIEVERDRDKSKF